MASPMTMDMPAEPAPKKAGGGGLMGKVNALLSAMEKADPMELGPAMQELSAGIQDILQTKFAQAGAAPGGEAPPPEAGPMPEASVGPAGAPPAGKPITKRPMM